jgi:glycosyltransferase involved in cell wall biosynthesis
MHSPFAQGGGETIHVVTLSQVLAKCGIDVTVVVHEGVARHPEFGRALADSGVRVIALPNLYRLPTAVRILLSRLMLRRQLPRRFDAVICHGTGGSHFWFRRFKKRGGLFIWHDHMDGGYRDGLADVLAPAEPAIYPSRFLRVLRAADTILIGTDAGAQNLRRLQGSQCPIHVLAPLAPFDTPTLSADPNSSRPLRIASFGRLESRKCVESLLRLWRRAKWSDCELHFYGPDPDSKYAALSAELGLEATVRFHGAYDHRDIRKLMAETDLGLFLSRAEGFGLVGLEYMAHGVPFVMTDVGAARLFTADNPDAALAPLSEDGVICAVEQMMDHIRQGLTSRRRLQMHYETHFSFDRLASGYVQFLLKSGILRDA